ncbi:MAG: DUF3108 domain-containing protein [Pseudomonadota bacterium]
MQRTTITIFGGLAALTMAFWSAAPASDITPGGPPSPLAPVPLNGDFELFLGGLKAADLMVTSSFAGEDYRARARVATAGMVATLYEASIDVRVEGSVIPSAADASLGGLLALAPRHFRSESINPRQPRQVEMRYVDGAPEVRAEPDYDDKPWAIDPADQAGKLDPVSAIIAGLGPSTAALLCNRRVEIFDARRHFAIALGEARAPDASGEIRCDGEYIRLSGFKPNQMAKPNIEVDVFFRPRGDGLWELERIIGETPVGTAVIRRRRS